jgi:hypothetical protein
MNYRSMKSFARLRACPHPLVEKIMVWNFCTVGAAQTGWKCLSSNFFYIKNKRGFSPKINYYNSDETVIQPPDSTYHPDVMTLQNVCGQRLSGFCVHFKEAWIQRCEMKSNTYIVFIETHGQNTAKVTGSNMEE